MKILTLFNLLRTLHSHPEILKRVLHRMKEEDREGFDAALLQGRRAIALLFEEMKIHDSKTDVVIAKWGD